MPVSHTGLTMGRHLWAGKLYVLISKADCNLTTKSSKNKFCTCERCHLVCLRGWSCLLCTEWEQHWEWRSWFSSNHSYTLAGAKKRAHTFPRRALCCLGCPFHLSFHCGNCPQSGTEGRYSMVSASSDGVTLAFAAFLPGKSKATGSEMIFPFSNMRPESSILHVWPLANLPPCCPHAWPSFCITHTGSLLSISRTWGLSQRTGFDSLGNKCIVHEICLFHECPSCMKNTKFSSEVFILQAIYMHSGRLEDNKHLSTIRACKPCATGLPKAPGRLQDIIKSPCACTVLTNVSGSMYQMFLFIGIV